MVWFPHRWARGARIMIMLHKYTIKVGLVPPPKGKGVAALRCAKRDKGWPPSFLAGGQGAADTAKRQENLSIVWHFPRLAEKLRLLAGTYHLETSVS